MGILLYAWRQGFAQAGFPGPDQEAALAMDCFEAAMATSSYKVLVDMLCATGPFTRRFAASGKYKRVLGCDYSASMLHEAGKRIRSDKNLNNLKGTQLGRVRLEVGMIPMKGGTVDDILQQPSCHPISACRSRPKEALEVPAGRLSNISSLFKVYCPLEAAGFEKEKVSIEVLGAACVVIRCEK